MPASSPDQKQWMQPQWFVIGGVLAAFGLAVGYDLRLGLAVGALLGVVAAMWLYLALRYGSLSGAPSGRSLLAAQVRQQHSNRRSAAAQAIVPSGPQQRADPPQRP